METQALLAALTELAARAGHDMVGPLNQAGSLLALFIKRYRGKLDAEADQLLEFLQGSASRMEGVIEGLRDYFEALNRTPVCSASDLTCCLTRAREHLQKQITESGASIESDPLPTAFADAAQIACVFQQLIENAIKFRNPDRPLRIHVSAACEAAMVTVTVQDTGMGIDPENAEMIFLPFKRLNGREYPGAGLGLAAVKAIIEMHGGNIRVVPAESPDAGTTIEFTLRAA